MYAILSFHSPQLACLPRCSYTPSDVAECQHREKGIRTYITLDTAPNTLTDKGTKNYAKLRMNYSFELHELVARTEPILAVI